MYKTQSCGGATFLKLYRATGVNIISPGGRILQDDGLQPGLWAAWVPTATPSRWHPMPVRAAKVFSFALRPSNGTRRAAIGYPGLVVRSGKGSRPDLPRNEASWPGVHKGVTYHRGGQDH